jgi:class 3 adenylate cyclase
MTTLRATAIMKTDISGSTARFRALVEPDLTAVLPDHHHLVSRIGGQQDGRIVKAEGDGLWLVFPSVTAASLAAMAIQEELRIAQPGRGDDRLAMRIVITLGDVLTKTLGPGGGIFVSSRVRDDLRDTRWAARLQPVELARQSGSLAGIVVCRLV